MAPDTPDVSPSRPPGHLGPLLYTLMKQHAISSNVAAKAHFAYWFFKDHKTVLANAQQKQVNF